MSIYALHINIVMILRGFSSLNQLINPGGARDSVCFAEVLSGGAFLTVSVLGKRNVAELDVHQGVSRQVRFILHFTFRDAVRLNIISNKIQFAST